MPTSYLHDYSKEFEKQFIALITKLNNITSFHVDDIKMINCVSGSKQLENEILRNYFKIAAGMYILGITCFQEVEITFLL